jgi:hypothetical protein
MGWRNATLLFALLALFVPPERAQAQRAGEQLYVWKEIAVDPSQSEIAIDMTDARGAVRGLRVRTPNGALLMSNVRVVYSDGRTFDERRRINLLRGERTRPINPTRGDRFVDRIILFVDPDTRPADSVDVQILSHQTRAGRRMSRPAAADETPTATAPEGESATTRRAAAEQSPGTILDGAKEDDGATGQGEVLFGAQRVGLGLDRDTVRVSDNIGHFRRIRLRVLENDIVLNGLTIVYADGSTQDADAETDMKAGTSSRWFDVDPEKFIREVRLRYRSRANFKGRARVELFGEFTPGWLGPDGKGRNFNDGWVLLGAQTAGFVGFDDDTVPVGRNKGGFRQVRVTVRDRAITLNELRIVYADGASDTVPIKARVNAGSSWGPVDLKGDRRPIKEVKARYRSRFFDREAVGRGAAIVEVWGRY